MRAYGKHQMSVVVRWGDRAVTMHRAEAIELVAAAGVIWMVHNGHVLPNDPRMRAALNIVSELSAALLRDGEPHED